MTGLVAIRVGFGKAIFTGSTYTMSAMVVGKPWIRSPAATSGTRIRGAAVENYVGAHGAINGTLYNDGVQYAPGTILLLGSCNSRKGVPVSEGAILLRLRPQAAYLNVSAVLPPDRANVYGNRFSLFQGNADILSIDEAKVLGVEVPRGYVERFFQPDEIAERFDIVEVHAETAPAPEFVAVSTPSGIVVKEMAAVPQRRIRIRK